MPETRCIYRVHHKNDIIQGMYKSRVACENMQPWNKVDGVNRHPAPCDDSALSSVCAGDTPITSTWFYGFASIEQFDFWVYKDEWREQLDEEGFVISRFTAPSEMIVHGRTQALIHPQTLRVARRDTISLLNVTEEAFDLAVRQGEQ